MHVKKTKPLCFQKELKMLCYLIKVISNPCVHLMYQLLFYVLCGYKIICAYMSEDINVLHCPI